jgi:hypothetical protein
MRSLDPSALVHNLQMLTSAFHYGRFADRPPNLVLSRPLPVNTPMCGSAHVVPNSGPQRGKDSGVRDALHQAAQAEGCDFPGLGPHSFRRANITWRQQVGGSAIEASKIAGHSDLEMTGEYTCVSPERQNELTRRIQEKLRLAVRNNGKQKVLESGVCTPGVPDASPNLERQWRRKSITY